MCEAQPCCHPPPKPPSSWRRGVQLVEDLGSYAKFLALLLASLGLLAVYAPTIRRFAEVYLVGVDAYYNIGQLIGPPLYVGFDPNAFSDPMWDDGLQSPKRFFDLSGHIVFAKQDWAIGRIKPSGTEQLLHVYRAGACVYVKDVYFKPYTRRPRAGGAGEIREPSKPVGEPVWSRRLSEIRKLAEVQKKPAETLFTDSLPPNFHVPLETCRTKEHPELAMCPRVAVWVKGRKVTC
jgi:hypothetical protein